MIGNEFGNEGTLIVCEIFRFEHTDYIAKIQRKFRNNGFDLSLNSKPWNQMFPIPDKL